MHLSQGFSVPEYVYHLLWAGHFGFLLLPRGLFAVFGGGYFGGLGGLVITQLKRRDRDEGSDRREAQGFLGLLFEKALRHT